MDISTIKNAFLFNDDGGVISLVGAGGKTSLMFRLAHEFARAGAPTLSTTTTKIKMPSPEQSSRVILADSLEEIIDGAKKSAPQCLHLSAGTRRPLSRYEKLGGFPPETIDQLKKKGPFQWIIVESDGAAMKPLKAPAPHEPVTPASSGWVIGVIGLKNVGKPLNKRNLFRPELFSQITGLKMEQPISEESVAISIAHDMGIMKGSPDGAIKIAFLNMADDPAQLETGRRIAFALKEMTSLASPVHRVIIGNALGHPLVVECHDVSALPASN